MKNIILSIVSVLAIGLTGCVNLDLTPPDEASSESWYKQPNQFEMAVDGLYRGALWYFECNRAWSTDRWSDDFDQQGHVYDWVCGSLTGKTDLVVTTWMRCYKSIGRANTILENVNLQRGNLSDSFLDRIEGEAHFFRAAFYSYLIFLWGDVPYYEDHISLEEAYSMGRVDQNKILKVIYEDFDKAAELLPETSETGPRIVKAAAYAFKARIALWMNDYATVAKAAKDCMDLGTYSLDPDYEKMFLSSTNASPEFILMIPRAREFSVSGVVNLASFIPKNNGGNSTATPSIELFSSFLCTDGLPIDKSPLFDRQNPFKNRDPRLGYTMVEYGSNFLGFEWDPSKVRVTNYSTGRLVRNKDCRINDTKASWTGQILKKWIDESVLEDRSTDMNCIIMRYADVLLMYAEGKIETNDIDQSVLDAINEVRARAYKVDKSETTKYPAVTETDQTKLRSILRQERRMELSWENRRWFDLVRWHLCEKAFNRPTYGLADATQLQKNIDSGDWFYPANQLPIIEDDGLVNCSPLIQKRKFKVTMSREFDVAHYHLPLPIRDVDLLPNIEQNPGY